MNFKVTVVADIVVTITKMILKKCCFVSISVERMNYSVPYEYIRQKVDMRLTKATVEVFYNGTRICLPKSRSLYLPLNTASHAEPNTMTGGRSDADREGI